MPRTTEDPRGFNALYDAMTQAWRHDRFADAWNHADTLLRVLRTEGSVPLAAPRDLLYARAIHAAYAPPPAPEGTVTALWCCGNWVDYPAPGSVELCPSCSSVFTLAMAEPAVSWEPAE